MAERIVKVQITNKVHLYKYGETKYYPGDTLDLPERLVVPHIMKVVKKPEAEQKPVAPEDKKKK
jgi:hypothetical protein